MPVDENGRLLLKRNGVGFHGAALRDTVVFAFGYRPNRGADRRPRIFYEEPEWQGNLNSYIVNEHANDSLEYVHPFQVSWISFALRFGRWIDPKYKRGEFVPSTAYEFGRRTFETLSIDEALVLADSTLVVENNRRAAHWRNSLPNY